MQHMYHTRFQFLGQNIGKNLSLMKCFSSLSNVYHILALLFVGLGITTLHNSMILSTLTISSHGFALGFPKKSHSNRDVFLYL